MLPTLAARRDEISELTRPYGQIIVDECHHLAAGTYDDAVKRVGAQFWLGLTATPDRRDGLGEVITWQLGPIRHTLAQTEPGTLMDALRDVTGPRRVLHIQDTTFRHADIDPTAPGTLAEVHRALVADEARNAQLVSDIAAALARGRNCLVLTRRIAHVEALASMLAHRQPIILQGGMTATDRRAAVERLSETQAGDGVLVIGTTPAKASTPPPSTRSSSPPRSPLTACSSNALAAWSAPRRAKTSPRSTTTTTRQCRCSPPHSSGGCPAIGRSASPRPDRRLCASGRRLCVAEGCPLGTRCVSCGDALRQAGCCGGWYGRHDDRSACWACSALVRRR